jgi:hypothetical protein
MNKGMPVYPERDKKMADSLSEIEIDAWYPADSVTKKLWRCVECLRDLDLVLERLPNHKSATKWKRTLKIAVTPLHSLALAIDDLCNDFLCNKETSSRISESDKKEIDEIKKIFGEVLPHDRKSVFTGIRNRLSSHIDKKIHPYEAQKLTQEFSSEEFGKWLCVCIHVIFDLNKIDIYAWSCKAPSEEYVRFMTNEPFVITMLPEGPNGAEMIALNIAKNSPREEVPELVELLIKHSKWLFKKGESPIKGLNLTPGGHWNTFKNAYGGSHRS